METWVCSLLRIFASPTCRFSHLTRAFLIDVSHLLPSSSAKSRTEKPQKQSLQVMDTLSVYVDELHEHRQISDQGENLIPAFSFEERMRTSAIFAVPSRESSRFALFKSRWMICRECIWTTPLTKSKATCCPLQSFRALV